MQKMIGHVSIGITRTIQCGKELFRICHPPVVIANLCLSCTQGSSRTEIIGENHQTTVVEPKLPSSLAVLVRENRTPTILLETGLHFSRFATEWASLMCYWAKKDQYLCPSLYTTVDVHHGAEDERSALEGPFTNSMELSSTH